MAKVAAPLCCCISVHCNNTGRKVAAVCSLAVKYMARTSAPRRNDEAPHVSSPISRDHLTDFQLCAMNPKAMTDGSNCIPEAKCSPSSLLLLSRFPNLHAYMPSVQGEKLAAYLSIYPSTPFPYASRAWPHPVSSAFCLSWLRIKISSLGLPRDTLRRFPSFFLLLFSHHYPTPH
nr:hypothetical protein CFP56_24574 [Quercus suber]